jgi:hypothetical protein
MLMKLYKGGVMGSIGTRVLVLDIGAVVLICAVMYSGVLPWVPVDNFAVAATASVVRIGVLIAGLYAWAKLRAREDDTRSFNEQLTGLALIFTSALTFMFFVRMQQMGWHAELSDHGTYAFARDFIHMLIAWWVLSSILTRQALSKLAPEQPLEDERDHAIIARANRAASELLTFLLIAIIARLAFADGGLFGARESSISLFVVTPANIAHWLIGALLLETLVSKGYATWLYRRSDVSAETA